MTVYRRRLVCFALALSLLCMLIPAGIGRDAALAEPVRRGITLDKVNVRYGPSTSEKIMFSLPKDHVCIIREEKINEKIRWYRVETIDPERKNSNTYFGYIHGDFFRELTDEEYTLYTTTGTAATPTPVPQSGGDSPTPTPTPAPAGSSDLPAKAGTRGVVTAGGTNLREGPGTGYHSLMKLNRNDQLEILTIPSVIGPGVETFYKVRFDGVTGYIMSNFVSILSGGAENGSSVVVTATPAPTNNNSSNNSSDFTHVKLILSSCHLRVKPGGDYDAKNDWTGQGTTLPLSKNGKTYYVRSDCVQPFSSGGSTPTPANTGTPTPAPTETVSPDVLGWVQTIVGGCNLRATIGGTVIKQIAKNVKLPYLLTPVSKNGYTWYFVQDGNNRGYLRSDVVKVIGNSDVTPTPAPTGSPDNTPTPAEQPIGWVKTISGGVNLRKNAGYSDVIGTVTRNVVLPYYSTTTVKGVVWYQVVHPTLGKGFLHGNYVTICNQDGSAIATPTPDPSVTAPPDGGGNGQEASYTTLKTGSTGNAVKNLVQELINQGYYSGSVTNKYTTAVAEAVKAFQTAKGLTADGIAGSTTQHKLYGTVPIGSGDKNNLTMTLYPAEKIDWYTGGINEMWPRGANYKVYDVKTGIVWWAHRWAGGRHVDAEPLTAADTARLCKCYGVNNSTEIASKNLYQRRPLLVTIGTRTFACSLYGVPHNYPDGDTISTNDFKGQVCIHFTNSRTHDSNKVDSGHEQAIEYAWEHAPNGHK